MTANSNAENEGLAVEDVTLAELPYGDEDEEADPPNQAGGIANKISLVITGIILVCAARFSATAVSSYNAAIAPSSSDIVATDTKSSKVPTAKAAKSTDSPGTKSSKKSASPSASTTPSFMPSLSSMPTTSNFPSAQPTTATLKMLRRTILDKVYGGGDDSTFDGPSAAFDAINWLYDDCNNCGQFCSGNQVVQRYILAVFYFSTNFNGENSWMRCSAPNNLQSNETCWVQSSYGSNITYSQGPGSALGSRGFRWLTCNNECEWGGTHCNENGLINATDFVKNNLTGTLPPEVGALPELSVLRLHRSTFSGTIPSSYSDLSELTILDLSRNWGLSGNLIDLSKMTKLQQLSLPQNRLNGTIPSSYSDLTELTILYLGDNLLSGNLIDLSKMTKLQQLNLRRNRLGGYLGGLGWEKTNLQVINLSYNNFEGYIPGQIFQNPNLTSTYFQCNNPDNWYLEDRCSPTYCPKYFLANQQICETAIGSSSCACTIVADCD